MNKKSFVNFNKLYYFREHRLDFKTYNRFVFCCCSAIISSAASDIKIELAINALSDLFKLKNKSEDFFVLISNWQCKKDLPFLYLCLSKLDLSKDIQDKLIRFIFQEGKLLLRVFELSHKL